MQLAHIKKFGPVVDIGLKSVNDRHAFDAPRCKLPGMCLLLEPLYQGYTLSSGQL